MAMPILDQSELQTPTQLKELVLYGANYSQDGIIFEPRSGVATISIHGHFQQSNTNPSPICQLMTNPEPIEYQPVRTSRNKLMEPGL